MDCHMGPGRVPGLFSEWMKNSTPKRSVSLQSPHKVLENISIIVTYYLSFSPILCLFPYPTFLASWMLHPLIHSGREKLSNPRQNIYEGKLCFSCWMQQKPSYRAVCADSCTAGHLSGPSTSCWHRWLVEGGATQVGDSKTSYIAHLMMLEALQSILLLSAWLRRGVFQLCFILWINYSLLECVCTCMSFFVIAKGNGRAHLPHPDLIFLNALTPWQLLMHLQCQSHSSELQRWSETETWGDGDMGRWGGLCVQGWGGEVATRHSILSPSLS